MSGARHHLRRRGRAGAHAVEFALIIPIFALIMAGIMEFGWLFYMRGIFSEAVAVGCREGAKYHPSDSFYGPVPMAEASILNFLATRNVACADCSVLAWLESSTPNAVLRCELTGPYVPIIGMIEGMESLSFTVYATEHIELQP